MSSDQAEDKTNYVVTVKEDEYDGERYYSIWPAHRELPMFWKDAGKKGTKSECEAYIKEIWTDMRPLSLRKKMEELARNQANAGDS